MNTCTPLSLDGSFERIVNAGTTQKRKAINKWVKRTLTTILVLLSLELINIILWLCNVIPSIPSVYISEIVTCVVAFLAGRVFEIGCK